MKSGASSPTHLCVASSHQTTFLRSDQGLPSESAAARLYRMAVCAAKPRPFGGQPSSVPNMACGAGLVYAITISTRINPYSIGRRTVILSEVNRGCSRDRRDHRVRKK